MASSSGKHGMRTLQDVYDYIDAFNEDDFNTYTKYYRDDIYMNIKSLPGEKNLNGYLEWIKPLHSRFSEKLVPNKVVIDREGKYVVCEFHTQFLAKKAEYSSENFLGKWGPINEKKGPVVKMIVFYHLDADGQITQLESESTVLRVVV